MEGIVLQQVSEGVSFHPQANTIHEWDTSKVVKLLMREERMSQEDACECVIELKKWFTLLLFFPGEDLQMNEKVDKAWHCFLLLTQEYHAFCAANFGHYIHHVPNLDGEKGTMQETLHKLRQVYGEIPTKWWGTDSTCNSTQCRCTSRCGSNCGV